MRLTAKLITDCHWSLSLRMRSVDWQCSGDRYPVRPCAFCADITQRLNRYWIMSFYFGEPLSGSLSFFFLSFSFSSSVWSLREALRGCSFLFIILPKSISISIWIKGRVTKGRVLRWCMYEAKDTNQFYSDHYMIFIFLHGSPIYLEVRKQNTEQLGKFSNL